MMFIHMIFILEEGPPTWRAVNGSLIASIDVKNLLLVKDYVSACRFAKSVALPETANVHGR